MNITCPRCNGAGGGNAFLNYGSKKGCSMAWLKCHLCHGHGAVNEEVKANYDRGQEIKRERVARGVTLREEAERLGITLSEAIERERGYPIDTKQKR